MSFTVSGGLLSKPVKLTGNSVTEILVATKRTTILSVICAEIGAATPNLTVELYDTTNTTSYYLRFALAMTAKQVVVLNDEFVLPQGWKLRVTSSNASGQVDVLVNYLNPDATSLGGAGPR